MANELLRDPETVPFEREAMLGYLDRAIDLWRARRDSAGGDDERMVAMCYVDAFQSVRSSLFGEVKPP